MDTPTPVCASSRDPLLSSPVHALDAFYAGELSSRSSLLRESIDQSLPIQVRLENVDYFVGPKDKQIVFDVSLTFKPGRLACMMGINQRLPIIFKLENVDYLIGPNEKRVVFDVMLTFKPERLACMMGPSGSGKTTLLNIILGHASGKMPKGRILINEQEGIPRHFKSVAKLVPQEDVLLPSFTVRETLNFHGELVLPQATTRQEREARVEMVIQSLRLSECSDVKVGSVDERGISGGQRKRVSIGMELLSNPCVLCLDECTSGLDSASAESIVSMLKDLSQYAGKRTIITTIHQPSYRIFSLFDDVVLLTRGKVAYAGPMSKIEVFFSSIGHDVPARENPADHFMRLLQDEECVVTIPAHFAKSTFGKTNDVAMASSQATPHREHAEKLNAVPRYPTSKFHQVRVLFRRQSLDYLKDPHKFLRMIALKAGVGIMVGTVWWKKADPPRQSELFALQGALFMLVFNSVIETLAMTILTFPMIRSLLLREYKNGSYAVSSFYIATMLSMACFGIVFVLAMALPVYFFVGFAHDFQKLAIFMASMLVTTLIGNALGVSVGASAKDLIEAQNMLAPIIAPLALFSGFIIRYDGIPPPFRIFYHLSFFQYGIALYELNVFQGMVFSDYNLDIFHPMQIRPLKTGEEFLRTISLDPETHHISHYMLILVVYAAVMSFMGFFLVKRAVARKYS